MASKRDQSGQLLNTHTGEVDTERWLLGVPAPGTIYYWTTACSTGNSYWSSRIHQLLSWASGGWRRVHQRPVKKLRRLSQDKPKREVGQRIQVCRLLLQICEGIGQQKGQWILHNADQLPLRCQADEGRRSQWQCLPDIKSHPRAQP